MNVKRRCLWFLLFTSLAMGIGVSPAVGQDAVVYEVTESMKLTERGDFTGRSATAVLFGWVNAGTSVCPQWLASALGLTRCGVTVVAKDTVNLATGKGPASGNFDVVIQGDNLVDGEELVIVRGSFWGRVDLSPVVLGPDGLPKSGDELPLGALRGRWWARGVLGGPLADVSMGGTLRGTFRLPFAFASNQPLYMLDPSKYPGDGFAVPVHLYEHSLGVPTVRLELYLADD
ncbi:MAG TPA: hypothetical protein VJO34_11755 [Methylomirabilota bacterium]|nr:hypothetical protein [Methylomirabilota bacterium]